MGHWHRTRRRLHVGDLIPPRPGLEEFKVDEDGDRPSWMADAKTDEIVWSTSAAGDNGRGVSDDMRADNPGVEAWSAADALAARRGGRAAQQLQLHRVEGLRQRP